MTTLPIRIALGIVLGGAAIAAAAEGPPAVGQAAKEFRLEALDGSTVELSALEAQGPVVLVVLRGWPGYQCPICSRQFGELIGKADAIKAAGASVVFVYPGPAEALKAHAAEFVRGRDYPAHFRFATDPDYAFTNAYNLRWEAKNETAYPSTFVVDKSGKVTFAKVSKTHGDRAKTADVLKALAAN